MEENVKKIKLRPSSVGKSRLIRTACYCRVSTALDCQQLSLESQMEGFKKKINETPGMILAGVYADEGITGTSVRKRTQFLQMIRDAEDGKIDCIMTKSISRFARNTVECLQYVRKLKDIGVNVIFEKEAIDTSSVMSEMLLTVLAAFAQEESRSISENLKWGIRKRYETGEARWSATYGYKKDKDDNIVIQVEEAAVVKRIFEDYRTGITITQLVEALNKEMIPSPRGKTWTTTCIQGILMNEKYIGDMKLQKWISTDHISHKCIPNDETEVPSYYVRNHHDAIVSKRTFNQVQRILELRAPRGEITRYPYVDTKIICPFCGKPMVTRQMHVQKEKKAVCCFGDDGCQRFSVKTWMLDEALKQAFASLDLTGVTNYTEQAKRMREWKMRGAPESIEYAFLDDMVKQISFSYETGTTMQKHKKGPATEKTVYSWTVHIDWQYGLQSVVPLPVDSRGTEEPVHVAELYKQFLDRIISGEYVPARPKSIHERKLKEANRGASVTRISKKEEAE